MRQVVSEDGTRIAYDKIGQGPSLVIIGGALGDHRFYAPLASELAREFTVYAFTGVAAARAATHSRTRWAVRSRTSPR